MQSKLKSVTPKGTHWDSPNGIMYHQDVVFENGDDGVALSKTEIAKWKVGEEYTYEISEKNGHKNIKGIKPVNGFGGGGKYDSTGARVGAALNNAVSMYIAGKFGDDNSAALKKIEPTADWLIDIAERLEAKHKK